MRNWVFLRGSVEFYALNPEQHLQKKQQDVQQRPHTRIRRMACNLFTCVVRRLGLLSTVVGLCCIFRHQAVGIGQILQRSANHDLLLFLLAHWCARSDEFACIRHAGVQCMACRACLYTITPVPVNALFCRHIVTIFLRQQEDHFLKRSISRHWGI